MRLWQKLWQKRIILLKKNNNIVGRTKHDCENFSKNDIFSKNDYYRISRKARELLISNNIKKLPIDLFSLVKKNGWGLISFKDAKKKIDFLDEEMFKQNWGFTIHIKNFDMIFYDDEISFGSQRFTIAHEIGHIVLKHLLISSEVTREKEANMFAARILMPMCVLLECNVLCAKDIESMCNVSEISAKYRFERLQVLKERNKFYTDRMEEKIKKQFSGFIKKQIKKKADNI